MYSEVEGLERVICQIEDKITTLLPFVNCVVVSWREQRIQALLQCGEADLKSDEIRKLEDSLQGTLHILQQYNARATDMANTSHFKRACAAFKRCFDEHDDSPSGMVLQVINQQDENHGLVFKRELLPPSSQTGNPRVEYYLRWHVTWGPVLTFTLHDLPPRENSHDLELAYRYLVRPHVRPQDELRLKNGGVGGIKGVIRWTDQFPSPCFLVDPCGFHDLAHEFEWKSAIVTCRDLVPVISTYGRVVGLDLPLSVADAILKSDAGAMAPANGSGPFRDLWFDLVQAMNDKKPLNFSAALPTNPPLQHTGVPGYRSGPLQHSGPYNHRMNMLNGVEKRRQPQGGLQTPPISPPTPLVNLANESKPFEPPGFSTHIPGGPQSGSGLKPKRASDESCGPEPEKVIKRARSFRPIAGQFTGAGRKTNFIANPAREPIQSLPSRNDQGPRKGLKPIDQSQISGRGIPNFTYPKPNVMRHLPVLREQRPYVPLQSLRSFLADDDVNFEEFLDFSDCSVGVSSLHL